jgi:hypothetical protein
MSLFNDALESDASLETILALMQRGDFVIDSLPPAQFHGTTPLLTAIKKRRVDVALELILRGANVELTDQYGHTPLTRACFENLQSTARALVQAGADTERADKWTPLGYAAVFGHLSLVRMMLSWGADPNGVGTRRETARTVADNCGHGGVVKFLKTSAWGSILVVRSAEEVRRLAKHSALKRFPKDLGRMVGSMLV